ncbi:MAG TPA: aminotransferase class V-fold PLP-dependent enzyme [Gemmataceae bacterium]|nr:aminotransferase class V-fold PLP-dependent enzyme [Gemmataceae bacterium]
MHGRREFIRRAAVGAAILGMPVARAERVFGEEAAPLPTDRLFATDPERYWSELRRQWLLAPERINLNCGSVGCTPLPVLRAMIDHLLSCETFREPGYPWAGYEENALLRQLRAALAAFLHCKRDEIALVRNATEANNVVCNGLDLKAGDEALLTDQEHSGGRCCWEQRAARHGIKLNYVKLPRPPATVNEIIDLFQRALRPRTRIIAFSHITSPTGLLLPAREICTLARQRGIMTHIDGAHAIGQIPLDLPALGCDFYASSPHKWLMAPKGTGLLYIREHMLERLWVNTASNEWHNYAAKAYRFCNVGTSNLSIMAGLKAALDFHRAVGPERIYARIHALAKRVRDHVAERPELRLLNASAEPFYAGLVSFESSKGDLKRVAAECAASKIRFSGGAQRMRISTHIFTQPAELQTFFTAIDRGLRT